MRNNKANRKQVKLRAIDLFAGCGGLTLGLKQAGFEVVAAIEIDNRAAFTYRLNHKSTRVLETGIQQISAKNLMKVAGIKKGDLDLLAGCPPCQGFSRLARYNGRIKRDPRNRLVKEFERFVKDTFPKTVLMENVPALARSSFFKSLVRTLKRLSFTVSWGVLDAADFGVPQRRRRLILMASRVGVIDLPKGTENSSTVSDIIKKLPDPRTSSDPVHALFSRSSETIKKRIAQIPKNGGSREDVGPDKQLKCHQKCDGFKDVYGRMQWDKVAPTITSGCFNPSKGRFLHPSEDRPISIREASLLQSFPRDYKFSISFGITALAKLVGDALPPLFAKHQALHIKGALNSVKNG
jgi:DNA (cytosine-5)-methyltransferase 1